MKRFAENSNFYDYPDLYDALLPVGAEVPFYVDLARQQAGAVLELACGQCFDAGDGFEVSDERTTVREGRTARLVVRAKAGRNRRWSCRSPSCCLLSLGQ